MNLKQSKRLLNKINALHKSISIEDETVSAIERDLMLSYIRQLYEQFIEIDTDSSAKNPKTKAAPKVKKTKPVKTAQVYTPPKIVKVPESIKALVNEPVASPPPPKAAAPIELDIVTPPPPVPVPVPTPSKAPSLGKFKGLFGSNKKATELSEKLSLRPIKDLSKGIAINDRLLYVNDLFDKDNTTFGVAIKKLNSFSNMDEAQALLLGYAKQYNWLDEEKEDTAHSFIKLVKRRYI